MGRRMKLLVSIVNIDEARIALKAGCDIIDIKNPDEGSLGANHPKVIKEIVKSVGKFKEISATIGDLPNLPGTASLAAYGAASLGVKYVKAGMYGVKEVEDAIKLARWISEAIRSLPRKVNLILCGYGDANFIGSVHPKYLNYIACKSDADGILIDLKSKNSKTLFDYLNYEELSCIVNEAHNAGLTVALAGGLSRDHVYILEKLGIDIMGVRRSVCTDGDWTRSKLSYTKLRDLYLLINKKT